MSDKFDWSGVDDEELVVESVQAVAVYLNPRNNIVIRQQAGMMGEEDNFIVLPVGAAERLIAKLTTLIEEVRAAS